MVIFFGCYDLGPGVFVGCLDVLRGETVTENIGLAKYSLYGPEGVAVWMALIEESKKG